MPPHRSGITVWLLAFGVVVLSCFVPAGAGAAGMAQRLAPDAVSGPGLESGAVAAERLRVAQGGGSAHIDLYEGIDEALQRRQERGGIGLADAIAALERLVADGLAAENAAREALKACDRDRYDAHLGALRSLAEKVYPKVATSIEDELLFTKWLASFSPGTWVEPDAQNIRRWEAMQGYSLYVGREIARRIEALPPFPGACVAALPSPVTPAEPREGELPQPPAAAPAKPEPAQPPAEQAPSDPRIDALSKQAVAASDELRRAAEACDAERYRQAVESFGSALGQLWSLHDQWSALALRGGEVDPRYLRDWQRAARELAELERLRRTLPTLEKVCRAEGERQAFHVTRLVQFTFPYSYPGDITCWEEGIFRVEMTVLTGAGDELAGDGRYTLDAQGRCQAPSPIVDRGTVRSNSDFAVRGTLTGNHLRIEGPQHPPTQWTMGWPRDGGWYETTNQGASTVPDAWRIFDAELEDGRYEPFGYGAALTLPFFPPAPGQVTLQTRTVTTIRPLSEAELGAREAAGSGG